jgi:hypothetical protein
MADTKISADATVSPAVADFAPILQGGVNKKATLGTIANLAAQVVNGNSNVIITANSNVTVGVAGNAAIFTITGTGANITGTANISGNANVGNIGATGFYGAATGLTSIPGANVTGTVPTSNVALYSNITTGSSGNYYVQFANAVTGNVAEFANSAILANLSTGILYATKFSGAGDLLTGISLANGTSNVLIPASAGNVNISVGGVANMLVVTTTGANIAGTANITGNANVGNIGGTGAVFTTLGGSLTTAAQANITSVGLLTGLIVGNATANINLVSGSNGNVSATGNITAAAYYGPLANTTSNVSIPAAAGNVNISVGGTANVLVLTATGANIPGTANVTGNANIGNIGTSGLIVATGNITGGNLVTANLIQSANQSITGARSAAAWGTAGIASKTIASIYTDSSTAASGTVANAHINTIGIPTIAATNVTVTVTKAASFFIEGAPAAGTNISAITNPYSLQVAAGNVQIDTATTSTTTTTGALRVAGGIGVVGNVYAGAFYGAATGLTSIPGANITGWAPNANVANYDAVTTASTGNYYLMMASAITGNVAQVGNAAILANLTTGILYATKFSGDGGLLGNISGTAALTNTYVGFGNAAGGLSGSTKFTWIDSNTSLYLGTINGTANVAAIAQSNLTVSAGAGSGSIGSNLNLYAGDGGGSTFAGGHVNIISGNSTNGGAGNINITGGHDVGGSGGTGGYIYISGGSGITSQPGGNVTIIGGPGPGGFASGGGGTVVLYGGNGAYQNAGLAGDVLIGAGVSASPGTNGKILVQTNATERLRILADGSWSVGTAGSNVGTSGWVLTSNGTGSAPTWQAASGGGATLTDDNATSTTQYPGMARATTGAWATAYVASTKLTFDPSTGTLGATILNSTSDIKLKENISPIHTPIETIKQLQGVAFNWKETGKKSYGLIAQEVEKILPELVANTDGTKSLSYMPLIAYLIEIVKDQEKRIQTLENGKINT